MSDKPIVYNLYLDESGSIFYKYSNRAKEFFIVGGYLIKGFEVDAWKNHTITIFDKLQRDFPHITYNELVHRTVLNRNEDVKEDKYNITSILFENVTSINEDNGFVYIYEDKPNHINSTEFYYINLVSILVIKTLFNLVIKNQKSSLELNVILASRTDRRAGHIDYNKIRDVIDDKVHELQLKYGINNIKVRIKLQSATNYQPLIIADYFCNTIYRLNPDNVDNLKEAFYSKYSVTKNRVICDIEYTAFDLEFDICLSRRDYYNIISKFIFYNKLMSMNNKKYIKFAKDHIDRICFFLKEDTHPKKNRYIKEALKSILENIEYESNTYKDYKNIIDTYRILIDFCNLAYKGNRGIFYDYLVFLINVDRLATYNHKDDSNNAYALSKEIEQYIHKFNNDNIEHRDIDIIEERFITYYNISSIMYWHLYDVESSIASLEDFISHNDDMPSAKIAPLYGTLGQTYIIRYYVTNDPHNFELAILSFNNAIEKFADSKDDIRRIYNYFMLLYTVKDDSNNFILYLEKYLSSYYNKDISIEKDLAFFIDNEIEKDKSNYLFLIKRLLSFCAYSSDNEIKKNISLIILNNRKNIESLISKINNIHLVDIARDYSVICFKNKADIDYYNYISISIAYMNNVPGLMNDMRRASLYAVRVIMGNISYYDKMISIIKKLSSTTKGYNQTFKFIESAKVDSIDAKKEISFNIIKKLYM